MEETSKKVRQREIKDYLHLYLGCEMQYSTHHEPQYETYILTIDGLKEAIEFGDLPFLRPLSDMTEQEANQFLFNHRFMYSWINVIGVNQHSVVYEFTYNSNNRKRHSELRFDELKPHDVVHLLSKGFDLFGLIEEGLAIDKTKGEIKTELI